MQQKPTQYLPGSRGLFTALAIAALAAIGSPGTASATTTAGATIINIATVNYSDTSGTTSFKANFAASVTVNLIKSALSITSTPSGPGPMPALTCLATGNYASGTTFSAIYALTTQANGQDNYNLTLSDTPASVSIVGATTNYTLLDHAGTILATNPATRWLNSAVVVGIGTTNTANDTLYFPGGSLKTANGLGLNSMVVVNGTAYLVLSVSHGNPATLSNSGVTPSTSWVNPTLTPELQDSVVLTKFANNSLGIGSGPTGVVPNFLAATIGTVMGEMALVQINVTADSNVAGTNGSVTYTFTTADTNSPVDYAYVGSPSACTAGLWMSAQLNIKKTVANITNSGEGATATTGDILEYTVLVNSPTGNGQAALASVIDNVPSYTKLVIFPSTYGTNPTSMWAAANIFATITDGVNTVNLTTDGSSEIQPVGTAPTVGYGTAPATSQGSLLNFFLGQGSTQIVGGYVPSCNNNTKNTLALCTGTYAWNNTYTIKYRVQVQ